MNKRNETRLTIVDGNVRIFEKFDVDILEDIQDEGKTLKIFVKKR